LRLGPDGKIYVGTPSIYVPGAAFHSPHTIDTFNTFLSTIDYPDNPAATCGFNLWNVPLGRVYYIGLGNAPNYYLGPLVGSPCDTLSSATGISSASSNTSKITLAPNPAQTEVTLTWASVKEGNFVLRDMLGRAVLSEQLNTPNGTTRLDLSTLPKGIYLWQVQSAAITKNGKLVVE
jgi:hypothetical protein